MASDSSVDRRGVLGPFPILGIPVRFHFTFVLIVLLLIVAGLGQKASIWTDVIYIFALFGSVLLHELGHALVSRAYGIPTFEIVMLPIGGLAKLARTPRPAQELWIALAGPAVNLVIAGVLWLIQGGLLVDDLLEPTDRNLLSRIAATNLGLALFNLLPAFPMDGGRVLRSILALKLDETRATHYATLAGRAIAVLMGIYGLLNGYYILAAIAFFIYVSAAQENAVTASRAMVSGVPAESAMVTEFHTLSHGATAQEAADLLLKTSQQEFPVVQGDQVIGLLTRPSILAAMGAEGPTAYIAGYMSREVLAVPPWADLAEVLSQFGPATACALVMEPTAEGAPGRLLGMLTRENVIEFLALRRVESERAQRLAT